MEEEGGATVTGEELEVIDLEDEEYVPPTEEGGNCSVRASNFRGVFGLTVCCPHAMCYW